MWSTNFFSQFLMGGGVREGDRYFGVYELKSAGWLPTLRTDLHSWEGNRITNYIDANSKFSYANWLSDILTGSNIEFPKITMQVLDLSQNSCVTLSQATASPLTSDCHLGRQIAFLPSLNSKSEFMVPEDHEYQSISRVPHSIKVFSCHWLTTFPN